MQEGANNDGDDHNPCEIRRTSCNITDYLPGECLNNIFTRLETREDRNSFGLTCHQWLCIQNTNIESLWYDLDKPYQKLGITHENFHIVLRKLLSRFKHLKYLSLSDLPRITDFAASKPPFFESKVESLRLDFCSGYSDIKLSIMFSWFPRLTYISLEYSHITDIGLEALARCCSSLEEVRLPWCSLITDSGIRFLLENCRELGSLCIDYCVNITGIGFLGCPKTLTYLQAYKCQLKPMGIKAIVSGGGIKYLCLSAPYGEESINTETVVEISKGCPLLKKLILYNCEGVELEGWEAIGCNCRNLEILSVYGCRKLCDLGLQALCNGCNKLCSLHIDVKNRCSNSALELFKRRQPHCEVSFFKG